MQTWKRAVVSLLAAGAAAVQAAPAGVVEAVQGGAWVERSGERLPLEPGMAVNAGDRFATGGDGRLRMKLAEGSTVKLGRDARFGIEKAESRGGVFRAALDVAAGAFRFTTDPARQGEAREIEIKALHVTAGVRGTDLWGRVAPERSFIVLIEGRIEVRSAGQPALPLDRPLAAYERRGDAPPTVRAVDAATLAEYARETELSPDRPANPAPRPPG